MSFQKISVIGLGYVGLPTAAILASRKMNVVGVDINQETVNTINKGQIHIVEPNLEILVTSTVTSGYLKAVTIPEPSDVFMIATPTPITADNKADLSFVKSAISAISPFLSPGNLIILESTSPVGTTDNIARWIKELRPDLRIPSLDDEPNIHLAYCPERIMPGKVVKELVENDRIIGGMTLRCADQAESLYEVFSQGKLFKTSTKLAELAKLSENSYRDVNIAFANELSMICDQLDLNVWDLISLTNRHPRVDVLKPGPGVGGHCIAIDPWFIIDAFPEESGLIKQARLSNNLKKEHVYNKVVQIAEQYKKPVIACLGLSFKADVDDLRESPALDIVEKLLINEIGSILVVEPNLNSLPLNLRKQNVQLVDLNEALDKANVVVFLVEHKEFKTIDINGLSHKAIINTVGYSKKN
jgi:UDP-N-acetyl-D-mannosaminuronic acid dehydrogenase